MRNYTVRVARVKRVVVICLGCIILLIAGPFIVDLPNTNYTYGIVLFWSFACMGIGYFLLKQLAMEPLQVSLSAEELIIDSPRSGSKQVIKLDDIASFVSQEFNGSKSLRLRLHSGKKVTLGRSDTFAANDELPTLIADFQEYICGRAATNEHRHKPAIIREMSFFEKPIASVLGWIIVAGLAWFSIDLLMHGVRDGKWGALFMIYGNGLAYLGSWLAVRRNARN